MTVTPAVNDAQQADAVVTRPDTVIEIAVDANVGARKASGAGSSPKNGIPKLGISWEDVGFQVALKVPKQKNLVTKTILKNVSGEALPGELMVLMGPSGAGKSTLLDCISARNQNCTGKILVNGHPWSKSIAKHSCYVMQDDLFYANLTVLEHLTIQAKLRMERHWTPAQRDERVHQVINELGLTKVTNTPIGDANVKGLSGGQRKRLSFATELLTNPSLLFVDEPTSGLDSFMAETVVLMMRDLARNGRTVIATIHQPSSELFELFDRLYLLVDGRTVFNGKAADSITYFGTQGLQCPAFMNPTDYFMKQLVVLDGQPEAQQRVTKLIEAWAEHDKTRSGHGRRQSIVSQALGDDTAPEASLGFFGQLAILCKRNLMRLVRDAIGFKARIGSTLFITIMLGLIFLQRKTNQKGVQDFTGAIFFIAVNQMFSSANPEFISVPLELPIVMREHGSGLYHALTWYLAKNLSELPFQFFFPMLFLVPCYFMIGFGTNAEVFFSFYLFTLLISSSATGLGYMVSCMAKRVEIAPIIGILFILPFLLFGGLFLNSDSTPDYSIWLQQISPIKYAFHGLMRAFWGHVTTISCNPAVERCLATTGDEVLNNNSIKLHRMWLDIVVLVALNVGFRIQNSAFALPNADRSKVTATMAGRVVPGVEHAASPGENASIPRLAVSWKDISFKVKIKNPATKRLEEKQILRGVSGEALPGELMVLMGPSGAGKSSLLDCIASRNTGCTGALVVNGRPWSNAVAKLSCYVMQDDLFYANLTVLEHLVMQAELRMGNTMRAPQRLERVNTVIAELGLGKVRNTPIGDIHVKGLSGGQRKRLSLATELLTNPSLLFIDEPTSGLDSFMAGAVVRQMRDLAKAGRTVITTIHQPASDLFVLFDRLYLLVDGMTVFDGKAADSIEYFASHGFQCPPYMNPTDYFMQVLVVMDEDPDGKTRVDKLLKAWAGRGDSAEIAQRRATLAVMSLEGSSQSSGDTVSVARQLRVLCRRHHRRLVRDVVAFKARVGSTIFITVLVGLVFGKLERNQKGIQDFTGAIFFIAVNQLFSNANPELTTVPLEIPLILREHNGGLYHVWVWYLAKNIVEIPLQLVFPIIFLVPLYFMIGFGNNFKMFVLFYMNTALTASSATGLGYMVSCISNRVDIAPILGILFMLPMILFGGLFLNSASTPWYFVWLQDLSPVMYGFHGIMHAFCGNVDTIDCPAGTHCVATTGAQVITMNSLDGEKGDWYNAVILLAINIAFRLIGAILLYYRASKGRRRKGN
ncbi:TPA: hypothetical protein N0F65_008530 [Lagenidium giganteum]|uniref:ABC transporter domain-containing protein n=1 Tax=Lagenidium giganteum TaxID=4803 RepID=A0AAV2Z559_9STRA|nr:TPA: hypothetical protein N0F65_008530 [Lagenidium giganteum]